MKIWFIYVPAIVVILAIIVAVFQGYEEAKKKVNQQQERVIKK